MQIGLDAKRAYHNSTGLGVYSRTLIRGLAETFPNDRQFLFNPRSSKTYAFPYPNCTEVQPSHRVHRLLPSLWRSTALCNEPAFKQLDLFHGLSNELPWGIEKTGVPSVVTIHDLIFEHFPRQYPRMDVEIYRYKFKSACRRAQAIITPSSQTKEDIIRRYGTDEKKIHVLFNACDDRYYHQAEEAEKGRVKERYQLPDEYLLYVGSIIERKHLLSVCSALDQSDTQPIPLVVVGRGTHYKQRIQQFLAEKKMTNRVYFLEDHYDGQQLNQDLPIIYQLASLFIYPSVYEGFGLPLAEAMASGLPVITSPHSCLPEVGGEAACYVNPADQKALSEIISTIYTNSAIRREMSARSLQQAEKFRSQTFLQNVHRVYQQIASTN